MLDSGAVYLMHNNLHCNEVYLSVIDIQYDRSTSSHPPGQQTWRVLPPARLNSGVCSGWGPYRSYGATARFHSKQRRSWLGILLRQSGRSGHDGLRPNSFFVGMTKIQRRINECYGSKSRAVPANCWVLWEDRFTVFFLLIFSRNCIFSTTLFY